MVLKPMATDAKEPTFSMGDDTPFAAVAGRPRLVHHFLKQRFAQVTNPPIDHLRERLVMSLRTCLGPRRPLLSEGPEAARLLELPTFFLYPDAVDASPRPRPGAVPGGAARRHVPGRPTVPAGLRAAVLDAWPTRPRRPCGDGAAILVVADTGIGPDRAPVPALLATGAVHHRLIAEPAPSGRLGGRRHRRRPRRRTPSPASSATAPTPSVPAWRCRPSPRWPTTASSARRTRPRRRPGTRPRSRTACSRSPPRWASRRSTATAAPRSSRPSASAAEVVDPCLAGHAVGGRRARLRRARRRRPRAATADAFAVDEPALDEPGFVRFRKRAASTTPATPTPSTRCTP